MATWVSRVRHLTGYSDQEDRGRERDTYYWKVLALFCSVCQREIA